MKYGFRETVVLLATLFSTAAMAETWHADPISGCGVHDESDPKTRIVASWSGGCDEKGHASGEGVLSWIEDGQLLGRYVGEMQDGRVDGKGVLYLVVESGGHDRFEGQFRNDEIDGYVLARTAAGITWSTAAVAGAGR